MLPDSYQIIVVAVAMIQLSLADGFVFKKQNPFFHTENAMTDLTLNRFFTNPPKT